MVGLIHYKKMKFFIKCGKIRSFLQIWSHSLIENCIFCVVNHIYNTAT